jgi:transcriptional regulator with XRE-family HTH domain
MTELKTYLTETGEKPKDFAERVGTTVSTISRLCNGKLKPSLDLAHTIEGATGGRVPTETWVDTAEPQANAA